MEGSTSQKNDDDKTKPSQESSQESLIGANWPSLPVPAESQRTILDTTQDSSIQPAQKSPTPWRASRGDLPTMKGIGWRSTRSTSKATRFCPSLNWKKNWHLGSSRWSFRISKPKGWWGWRRRHSRSYWGRRASHASTSVARVLRRGMSSFLWKTRLRSWQPIT